MDIHVCSKLAVPNRLYRVHYPGSRTAFSRAQGFSASDTTTVYGANELADFKAAIANQFTWNCRASLPFISLFSDREHAENWARKEPWRGHENPNRNWSLHVIDTTRLTDTCRLFKLSDLIEELHVDLPVRAGQHALGAFLCLHRIPSEAIVEERNPEEVNAGKFHRRSTKTSF